MSCPRELHPHFCECGDCLNTHDSAALLTAPEDDEPQRDEDTEAA